MAVPYSTGEYTYINDTSCNEPEITLQLNKELNLARRFIEETGTNLFLTGKAGTGKTTFLRHLQRTSPKQIVVLAPTGVAAINAEGNTIHSFFQFPFAPFIPGKGFPVKDRKQYNIGSFKRRIINSIDILVIDEISMVRPDIMDAIDSFLRRFRNPVLPFGGVQLLLIGDLRQLPPVIKPEEWKLLANHYNSEYFFESKALKEAGFITIELTNIYRQSDPVFISILNAVRDGKTDSETLALLNSRFIRDFKPDKNLRYIRLCTHNFMADRINQNMLDNIPENPVVFHALVTGNFPESMYPAEFDLVLKKGAQVMFIKNDSGADRRFYNGMIGEIVGFDSEQILVKPEDRNDIVSVAPTTWENVKYVIDETSKNITQVNEGEFKQYPLRLAWAITIHKSQGLTFDRAIIDSEAAFASGQTYVALSRCKSLEGLVLGSPIPPNAILTDGKVNNFIYYSNLNKPDNLKLIGMKQDYAVSCFSSLFDFRNLKTSFGDFFKLCIEYVFPLHPELKDSYYEASEIFNEEIADVADRFLSLYARYIPAIITGSLENKHLFDKIKNGSNYFLNKLRGIFKTIENSKLTLGNAKYAARLQKSYDNVIFLLKMHLNLLSYFSINDFSVLEYIRCRSESAIYASSPQKSRTSISHKAGYKAAKSPAKPVGYSKHLSFELFQSGKTIKEIATERKLKEITILDHLIEFVKTGEIDPHSLISEKSMKILEKEYLKDIPFKEHVENLEGLVLPSEFRVYHFGYRKITKSDSGDTD